MSQSLTGTTGQMRVLLKSANIKIFRALLSIASAALLIRVMGMFNQIIVTARFGEGATMDAYFVASTLPIFLAQLIQAAVEASVIPVYSRVRTRGGKEQASILFSTLLNLLIISTALLTVAMLIFRQQVILISAPALDPLRTALAYNLTPIIFPVLLLMVIVGFLECILNAEGQFGWPAYAGLVIPVTTAILVVAFGKSQGVMMLCIGTLLGLCLQLCIIVLRARQASIVYRPVLDVRNKEIVLILGAAWPVLCGALISQASPLVDQIFASYFSTGSISALSYALKLISVPTGVIIVSVGRAALPYLSRQAAIHDLKAFKGTFRLYLWYLGIGTTLLSVFVLLLAHPLVQILFQHGAFTANDTDRTATILRGFVIGLAPMSLGFITANAFSALGKTRVLLFFSVFSVIANFVFDYIFAQLWQGFGIALATSAVYICSMCLLLFILRRTIGRLDLLTPPIEIVTMIRKIRNSYELHQQVIRIGLTLVVFSVGILGVFQNAIYTLRISLGLVAVLAFLRYRYTLLVVWVTIDVFIGTTLPFFNGSNLDTGLTASTLLLLVFMPLNQTFMRMPALGLMVAFLLWVFTSIGFSAIGVSAFLTEWLIRIDFVAISVLTIQLITTRQRMLRIIDVTLIICSIICVYGIYGYFTKQNGEYDDTIANLFRIGSTFGYNAPTLALFLTLILPLAIYRAFTVQGYKRVAILLASLLFVVTLLMTFARTAFISVPLSIIVMSFFLPVRRMRNIFLATVFALGVVTVIVATVYHLPIFERFFSQDILTLNNRTYIWQAILDHFDATQLLGNGLDASNLLIARLQAGYRGAASPHNLFLGALYDHGMIGATMLIGVFVVLFVSLIRGALRTRGEQRIVFATAIAVTINMVMLNLDSNDFWNQGIGIYFWIIVALPFALCWSNSAQASDDDEGIEDKETIPHITIVRGGSAVEIGSCRDYGNAVEIDPKRENEGAEVEEPVVVPQFSLPFYMY